MSGNFKRENREIPAVSDDESERSANASGGTADMHAAGKSDGSIVPAKAANKDGAESSAELSETRGPAKRNIDQDALHRTQSRVNRRSRGLAGVREAARKDGKLRFTALLHHVNADSLTAAFFQLKKTAAVGVDEVTWHDYEQDLQDLIADLHGRIHRGAYRAKPTRRVWIPKPDGRQRPLGVTSLEDKIVQQAVLQVLQSIYEQDFLGFSYGFRPGRSCHQALDALSVAIAKRMRAKVAAIKQQLRKRMHRPVGETGRWPRSVVQGWLNYYAVPGNYQKLKELVDEVSKHWLSVLRRRSQKGRSRWTWPRMHRLIRKRLPRPRILHPYPQDRFHARLEAGAV